jgi:mono/diheme cytochrome c family protein
MCRPLVRIGLAWLVGLALVTASAAMQEHPQGPHRHPEGEKLTNAIVRTPESIKAGAVLYAKSCSNCHGPNGLGNGRLAAAMAAYGGRPSDLTDSEWQHGSSDGEIFLVIRDGIGPEFHMPLFKGKLADEEIWHVVNYIRTLTM